VVIYRFFGGLPELLTTWSRSGRFWPRVDELPGDDPAACLALPAAGRCACFFGHFIDGLRVRPLTLTVKVMAAELLERNELTALLEAEREAWSEAAASVLGGREFSAHPALRGQTLLLVAGVQYLLLRGRRIRIFGGVDLQSAEGWAELKQALRDAAQRPLAQY